MFRSTVTPSDWLDMQGERDKYRAMAANAETMAAKLRVAIENHRAAMRERFAVTQGDPNEDDLALWAALGPETTGNERAT